MFVKLGQWLPWAFDRCLPVSLILAFCDLLFNTGLSLAFGGYNGLRIKTSDGFVNRKKKGGKS